MVVWLDIRSITSLQVRRLIHFLKSAQYCLAEYENFLPFLLEVSYSSGWLGKQIQYFDGKQKFQKVQLPMSL